ncbi:MAG: hypothetical protein ACQESB_04725, partial [Elusimicrobiota bacterium]
MDAGRKEEIAIGLWGFSEDLSDTARSEVRSYIEDNHINDINERVWNEFGVILVGDLDNVSEKNFYRTFALLLEEMLPPFVAYEDLPWPRINGIYSTPSREIRIDIEADSIPRVLFHEVGHYIHYGFNDKEKLETWSKLWDKSEQSVDYARKYGQRNIVEDFATMFEAYTFGNTRNFLAQTISNSYSGRDVRLRKIEFISGLFTHEAVLEDGSITEATYVYDVKKDDESGEYIFGRKAVALAEMEINGNIYILPDFERVLSETIL